MLHCHGAPGLEFVTICHTTVAPRPNLSFVSLHNFATLVRWACQCVLWRDETSLSHGFPIILLCEVLMLIA